MSIKGILLDIDNTLYEYDKPHKIALKACLDSLQRTLGGEIKELYEIYDCAKQHIHIQLSGTASSHNRLLYFQKMLELIDKANLAMSLDLYHNYWKSFNQNIVLHEGVLDFFQRTQNLQICFVTDLTADVQFSKLIHLDLLKYGKYLVTSEEAGREKPHPFIFMLALKKLSLDSSEVIMIGDSYQKDILGAANLNIQALWLNKDGSRITHKDSTVQEFDTFKNISEYIEDARSC